MRDGVKICADIYRPDTAEKLPALLAISIHNKDLQGPEMAETGLLQPAWSMLWTGPAEAGDTRFLVSRGYVHVIANPRGIAKSESGGSRAFDSYDLIEWIAAQPWCDGNVGMIGISGFGAEQLGRPSAAAAPEGDLSLRSPRRVRRAGGFRDEYPGGVIHLFRFLLQVYASAHQRRPAQAAAARAREAVGRGDGQPGLQDVRAPLQHPDAEGAALPGLFRGPAQPVRQRRGGQEERGGVRQDRHSDLHRLGLVRLHLQDASARRAELVPQHRSAGKKLCCSAPRISTGRSRSSTTRSSAGTTTGSRASTPASWTIRRCSFWVMGENKWRSGSDWPVPETAVDQVLPGQLGAAHHRCRSCRRAPTTTRRPTPSRRCRASQTNRVEQLRYLSEPLADDLLIVGPSVLNLFAVDRPGRHQLDRRSSRTSARTCRCRPRARASAT